MGHDTLNPLCLAVQAIMTRTLCQIHHMACLRLHHATDNGSRVSSHDGWWRQTVWSKDCRWLSKKTKKNVVLSIFKVSEHDNQPELENELLPQYVINTREHDGNVCFFRNDILQYETATHSMSSAEDRGRIDTSRELVIQNQTTKMVNFGSSSIQ